LIPKITMLNIFYVPCIIFVGGSQDYMLPWKVFAGRKRLDKLV
jgi:hypothetical protein